jgi:hypothetical protein
MRFFPFLSSILLTSSQSTNKVSRFKWLLFLILLFHAHPSLKFLPSFPLCFSFFHYFPAYPSLFTLFPSALVSKHISYKSRHSWVFFSLSSFHSQPLSHTSSPSAFSHIPSAYTENPKRSLRICAVFWEM